MGTLEIRQERETRAYYRLLRRLLTEKVHDFFNEEHPELTPRMAELMRQLDSSEKGPSSPLGLVP